MKPIAIQAGTGRRCSVAAAKMFARFELVHRAAVRALGFAVTAHVQVHLGVAVPQLHVSFGAGAEHAALVVQVLGEEFNGGLRHTDTCDEELDATGVSQWAYLGLRPLTMSKKAV